VLDAVGLVLGVLSPAAGDHCLHLVEGLSIDDRRLHGFPRPDPVAGVVPPQFGHVAERDVVDVNETSSLRCLLHTWWPV
jgi:hypothetical protein